MAEHNLTGAKGEELAVKYLEKKGYTILELNWRNKHLEIDIVARDKNTIVVAEVKTRRSTHFGEPEEWVTKMKQKNLIKAASVYIINKNIDLEVRFDIVSIVLVQDEFTVNHIEDAFYPIL